MKDLTVVIINYQTPDLLDTAIKSFKKFYPEVPLLIIDNGSKDSQKSKEIIANASFKFKNTTSYFLEENIFHGPAMDFAIKELIKSNFVFFLDSDTETKKGGFLEDMITHIKSDKKVYGVGETIKVNKRGYKSNDGQEILLTPYMLINANWYTKLDPFVHHGQPSIFNFRDAHKKGLKLIRYPVSNYIDHRWRGTADRFGYGLGLKAKLDYLLNKLGL